MEDSLRPKEALSKRTSTAQLPAQSLDRISHAFIESYEHRQRHHSNSDRGADTPEYPLRGSVLIISSDILHIHAKVWCEEREW